MEFFDAPDHRVGEQGAHQSCQKDGQHHDNDGGDQDLVKKKITRLWIMSRTKKTGVVSP